MLYSSLKKFCPHRGSNSRPRAQHFYNWSLVRRRLCRIRPRSECSNINFRTETSVEQILLRDRLKEEIKKREGERYIFSKKLYTIIFCGRDLCAAQQWPDSNDDDDDDATLISSLNFGFVSALESEKTLTVTVMTRLHAIHLQIRKCKS